MNICNLVTRPTASKALIKRAVAAGLTERDARRQLACCLDRGDLILDDKLRIAKNKSVSYLSEVNRTITENPLDELQRLRDAWEAMLPYIRVSATSKTSLVIDLRFTALCEVNAEDCKRPLRELVMEYITNRKPKGK